MAKHGIIFGPLRLVRTSTDPQIEAMADPKRALQAGLPTIEGAVKAVVFSAGQPIRSSSSS